MFVCVCVRVFKVHLDYTELTETYISFSSRNLYFIQVPSILLVKEAACLPASVCLSVWVYEGVFVSRRVKMFV